MTKIVIYFLKNHPNPETSQRQKMNRLEAMQPLWGILERERVPSLYLDPERHNRSEKLLNKIIINRKKTIIRLET